MLAVALLVGIIFGPKALNLFNPFSWGNVDNITLELSRLVLIFQVFAVGVELPNAYMYKHWRSLFYLLVPVMTVAWLVSSAFIYALIPGLPSFADALAIGACVTATDPVLASSVVGKGKFAKRVPGHIRNVLSAESGSNDGMAFPFLFLAIDIIHDKSAGPAIRDWVLVTVLYEVVLGCVLGTVLGIAFRKAIKFAERHKLIDRESFLSYYFCLALLCAGTGTLLGSDDLLISFCAGCAFAWDGWFTNRTEESHVSNVIDLIFNLSFFVYFGSIIPWDEFNMPELGLVPWRLVVIAILILLFRRIPIILALKPIIPDIRTWREALFCGHFGPIGVGAIFFSILARAELENDSSFPEATLPSDPNSPNYFTVQVIWPVTTFLILSSIIVHGSSIAVFTLGKHLNTLTLTFTYTRDDTEMQNEPRWLSRLPRLSIGQSMSFHKDSAPPSRASSRSRKVDAGGEVGPGAIGEDIEPPVDAPRAAARRHRHHQRHGSGSQNRQTIQLQARRPDGTSAVIEEKINPGEQAWQEGKDIIVENAQGEVVRKIVSNHGSVVMQEDIKREQQKETRKHPTHPWYNRMAGIAKALGKEAGNDQVMQDDTITEEVDEVEEQGRGRRISKAGIRRTDDIEMGNVTQDDKGEGSSNSNESARRGPAMIVDEDRRQQIREDSDAADERADRARETSVERRRREAVLGFIPDDEDDEPKGKRRARSPLPHVRVIDDDDEEEEEEEDDEDDDDNLKVPSKGIRFGDVSIEGGSFSLQDRLSNRHGKTYRNSFSRN